MKKIYFFSFIGGLVLGLVGYLATAFSLFDLLWLIILSLLGQSTETLNSFRSDVGVVLISDFFLLSALWFIVIYFLNKKIKLEVKKFFLIFLFGAGGVLVIYSSIYLVLFFALKGSSIGI